MGRVPAVLVILVTILLNLVASQPGKELFLQPRGTIPCIQYGYLPCGDGCIPRTWTCCPSRTGGCAPSEYCFLGSNGEYGCCPDGLHCHGPAGATTSYFTSTRTNTQTRTLRPPVVTPPANVTTPPPIVPPPTTTIGPNMTNTSFPMPPPPAPYPGTGTVFSVNVHFLTAGVLGAVFAAVLAI